MSDDDIQAKLEAMANDPDIRREIDQIKPEFTPEESDVIDGDDELSKNIGASQNSVERGKQLIEELSGIIKRLPDDEFLELLGTGLLDNFLKSILDPTEKSNYSNLNEFLLAKKARAMLIGFLQYAITHNYALAGRTPENKEIFISPSFFQWFDDGVLFFQGEKPFEGLIGLYRAGGLLSYAIAARDTRPGEPMGPDHFEFIDEAAAREHFSKLSEAQYTNLDEPVRQLELLLNNRDNDKSHYQEFLIKFPWLFGAEYKKIQRHTKLDDKNIPDFTGIRVHDSGRDIIEIKPPFTKMFRDDGSLNADFNKAWDQAASYLDFTLRNKAYLNDKGLRFENPKCYLILGFGLTEAELDQIRFKERMTPSVRILTYDGLLAIARNTITILQAFKDQNTTSNEK